MKKITKLVLLVLTIAIVICDGQVAKAEDGYECSHGYHTLGDKTLNGGVGNYGYTNRYYWVSSDFSDTYVTRIKNAVKEWIYTTDDIGVTTPISIVKTKTRSKSVFDVLEKNIGAAYLGLTIHYKSGKEYVGRTSDGRLKSNYSYTYIYINTKELDNTNYNISAAQKKATIAHEFGHAMGLSHNQSVPSSIMCQLGCGRTATRAGKKDLKAINHLYK